MKLLPFLLCLLVLAGCSLNQEYAEADAATIDTVGVEWLELVKQPAAERRTFTQEEIDRRQRKFDAWTYRAEKGLKRALGREGRPTEAEIAEATLKDLGR